MIENAAKEPMVFIIAFLVSTVISFSANYTLLDSLLKMHRSKTAVQKIKREYSFIEKWYMVHYKENCRHAVKFCNFIITFQRISWICLATYLFFIGLWGYGVLSALSIIKITVCFFIFIIMPSMAISISLARPILFGRSKKYSFEKYHNTQNHNSIF